MRGGACTICGAAAQRAVGLHQDSTLYDENINGATTAARATGVARIAEVGTRRGVEDACVCSSLSQSGREVSSKLERGPPAPIRLRTPKNVQGASVELEDETRGLEETLAVCVQNAYRLFKVVLESCE